MMRARMISLLPLALLMAGCQSAGGPQPQGAAAARSDFDLGTLKVVAFLGVAPGGTSNKEAVAVIEPQLERGLAGITPPFVVLPLREAVARAQRQGIEGDFATLSNYWRDQQKVDKLTLQRVCTALGLDGVLAVGLREWMQEQAAPGGDEPSYTKISAHLAVYAAESGQRVWRTRASRTVEATQYQDDDLDSVQGQAPTASGFVGGLRTGTDAPPVEEVSAKVVEDLVRDLAKGEQRD